MYTEIHASFGKLSCEDVHVRLWESDILSAMYQGDWYVGEPRESGNVVVAALSKDLNCRGLVIIKVCWSPVAERFWEGNLHQSIGAGKQAAEERRDSSANSRCDHV